MIAELDLRGNLYTEALKHARNILDSLYFETQFCNEMETDDHCIIMECERVREKEYEWFEQNCPWWIASVDRACIEFLT